MSVNSAYILYRPRLRPEPGIICEASRGLMETRWSVSLEESTSTEYGYGKAAAIIEMREVKKKFS